MERVKTLQPALAIMMALALAGAFGGTAAHAAGPAWLWVDAAGHKVFSDRPPPADIPDRNILLRPAEGSYTPAPSAPPSSAAVQLPVAGAAGGTAAGVDKALQEKRKAAEAAEAAKRKAEEDKRAQVMADNCARAMQAKSGLDAGGRMSQINPNGERVYLDEAGIAAESARLQGIIAENCR